MQQVEPSLAEENAEDRVHGELPLTPTRESNSQLTRYITSSSAKKKKVKETDCKFCHSNFSGEQLFKHMKSEKNCQTLYMKWFKVKSFESLVVKLFHCEMCYESKKIDMRKHLRTNWSCFKKYQRKSGEKDLEDVYKKVLALRRSNLSRSNLSSRTSEARKLENEKRKKKDEENQCKSLSTSLNEYKDSTLFANYRVCVKCTTNFGEYSGRQLKETEELFKTLQLENPEPDTLKLRRFGKFYLCSNCNRDENDIKENNDKVTRIGEISDGDVLKFFPKDEEIDGNAEVEETKIVVMLPKSSEALKKSKKDSKPDSDLMRKVYQNKPLKKSTIAGIYEVEALKYQQAVDGSQMFHATFKDFESKTLAHVEKLQSDLRVSGSDSWRNNVVVEMKHRREQFGATFLTVKLDLPKTSPEIIATCLIQQGLVLTVDKLGSSTGSYEIVYKVHANHTSDKDCDKDCLQVDLEEYIENGAYNFSDIFNKNVGTYVHSVHQKLTSFARCIVQAPASGLFSEKFYLMVVFNSSDEASIIGAIWPKALDEINIDLAKDNGECANNRKLIEFVEKNISAMKDPRVLRSSFNLSEEHAQELSSLVHEHQFHVCDEETCSSCSSCELPSLETIIKQACSNVNHKASKELVEIMKNKLKTLSIEDKITLSTSQWLEHVWEQVSGEISHDFELFTISFHDENVDISFEIDEDLTENLEKYEASPLTATYHYAISHSVQLQGEAVIKRLWVADSFIEAYNPFFLEANSPCAVKLCVSIEEFESLLVGDARERRFESEGEVDPNLFFTHKFVGLAEAVSSADKTKRKFKSSTQVEFVNAKPSRKHTFKKVSEPSEESFKLEGSEEHFKIVDNNISRHFMRRNGDLILAESCAWFDYVGREKSEELSKAYESLEIPESDVECVSGSGNLPEFLICSNGDALKKRKNKKLLTFPKPKSSFEEMYQKCLLFLPLKTEVVLLEPNLKDKSSELNEKGDSTLVEYNEKKFFEMKIFKATTEKETNGDNISDREGVLDCILDVFDDENDEETTAVGEPNENQLMYGEDALDCLLEVLDEENN